MGCNPSKDGGDAPGLVDKAAGGVAAANKLLSTADKRDAAETLLIPLCDGKCVADRPRVISDDDVTVLLLLLQCTTNDGGKNND